MCLLSRIVLLATGLMSCLPGWSQKKDFGFRRIVNGASTDAWYAIPLPADLYQHASRDLSDLRLFELKNADTLEVPYVVKVHNDVVVENDVTLDVFNKSTRGKTFFVTFEIGRKEKVNQLSLSFEEDNFNGFVKLEGSADLKEWFSVVEQQRILSIHRDDIDFKATTLNFNTSSYRYLRAAVEADVPLTFLEGTLRNRDVKSGLHHTIPSSYTSQNDKTQKQTVMEVVLDYYQPVSSVTLETESGVDYYRPFTIEALRDSARVSNGWTYYYDRLYSGYVTSVYQNRFEFSYVLARKIRITIHNADNPSLLIKSVVVSGPQIDLVGRLHPGDTYLYYGSSMGAPSYDVVHFTDKIPESPAPLTLGAEQSLRSPAEQVSPLLQSKLWVWAIMGVVIALLGYFTLKMMKTKTADT